MKNNMKKKSILVVIFLAVLVLGTGTYAWLSWSSGETSMVLTVGDINKVRVTIAPYKFNSSIAPSTTYEGNDYVEINASNKMDNDASISLYYVVNSIDDSFISENFKYTVLRSEDGGEYTLYKTGNFLEAVSGSNLYLFESELIPAKINYMYRVYLWIDGNSSNQIAMEKGMFDAELNVDIFSLE